MCRRASSFAASPTLFATVAVGWLLLGSAVLPAQMSAGFPLEEGTKRELVELQELWIQWLTAVQQGDLEEAAALVSGLLDQTEGLGMKSLPDLSRAAAAQAATFSGEGESDKAHAALQAAEYLQPKQAETALVNVKVARDEGRWLASQVWLALAGVRMLTSPIAGPVTRANLLHWLLVVLTLSACSFIGLEMATRGRLLVGDLIGFVERSLPPLAALVLTAVLMVWPVVLPAGLLWLALYWSVLLWGYGTGAARVVMVVVWIFLGGLPFMVSENARRLDLALSTPVEAVENLVEGRLTGSLFADLGVLRELLPDSPALSHLEADLHLRLRQWEPARNLYREVLELEGSRTEVLADLGTVYFYEGNLDSAVGNLQEAAAEPDASATVFFNLSRALSEQYHFNESEAMLRRANALDSSAVGEWMASTDTGHVVQTAGGFSRKDEIMEEIARAWAQDRLEASLLDRWRRSMSIPLALMLAGPAIGVFLLTRWRRRRAPREEEPWFGGSLERLRKAALPGLPEAEEKRVGATWLAVLAGLALISLPLSGEVGFSPMVGFSVDLSVQWTVTSVGLALMFVMRWLSTGDRGSKGI